MQPPIGPWSCLSGFHPEDTKGHTRLSEQPTLKWLAKRTVQRHQRHGSATIMENPRNSTIFAKSPLSQLVENPLVNILYLEQCMHGACIYDENTKATAPVRKSTTLLCFDIGLPTTIKICPGASFHGPPGGPAKQKHASILSGKSGYLAVYPWQMAVCLVKDLTAHAKQIGANLSELSLHTFETYWKCQRCRIGNKATEPHT